MFASPQHTITASIKDPGVQRGNEKPPQSMATTSTTYPSYSPPHSAKWKKTRKRFKGNTLSPLEENSSQWTFFHSTTF